MIIKRESCFRAVKITDIQKYLWVFFFCFFFVGGGGGGNDIKTICLPNFLTWDNMKIYCISKIHQRRTYPLINLNLKVRLFSLFFLSKTHRYHLFAI